LGGAGGGRGGRVRRGGAVGLSKSSNNFVGGQSGRRDPLRALEAWRSLLGSMNMARPALLLLLLTVRRAQSQTCSGNTLCPAPLLGTVANTTAGGRDSVGNTFLANEEIYGPFEDGFGTTTPTQNILTSLGCTSGQGSIVGGIDTRTAEQMIAHQCSVVLPRGSGTQRVSLLDECGGHTSECAPSPSLPTAATHTHGALPKYRKRAGLPVWWCLSCCACRGRCAPLSVAVGLRGRCHRAFASRCRPHLPLLIPPTAPVFDRSPLLSPSGRPTISTSDSAACMTPLPRPPPIRHALG
jgi:hypothetical protein